jgi:putative SOS response-associated peptidase YedK
MCYSAQIWSDYRRYVRDFKAKIGIKEFHRLFFRRSRGAKLLVPRGVEAAFANPQSDEEAAIWDLILEHRQQERTRFEAELFTQRTRLVNAERKLATKTTKTALEDQRIATSKIEWVTGKLADLNRTEPQKSDERMFPGSYVPVLTVQDGERIVLPMRFQCRPARAPADYDFKYPGTFNARRDSLEGFWRGEFGRTHAIIVAESFYENVPLHRAEGRELRPGEAVSNTVIQFKPQTGQDMLVTCLWSHWTDRAGEDDLDSFAFITDEPPPEVAAAGHDRCLIPLRRENLDTWLSPDPADLAAQYALLDDRERPFYQHHLLAA